MRLSRCNRKRLLLFYFVALLSLPAAAVEASQMKYVGGTAPNRKAGVVGQLVITLETSLIFGAVGNKIAIPYASIESFQYTKQVARHLGVLPTIAIA
jgi:hypothetical protein